MGACHVIVNKQPQNSAGTRQEEHLNFYKESAVAVDAPRIRE